MPLLLRQHRQVAELLSVVQGSTGADRQVAFDDLRCFLAAHEAAEEEAVHPAARTGAGGVVAQRIAEEHQAGQLITKLEQLDVNSAEFSSQFAQLKSAVESHAHREEIDEFPALSGVVDTPTLIRVHSIVTQVPALAALADASEPFTMQLDHHRQKIRGTADPGHI